MSLSIFKTYRNSQALYECILGLLLTCVFLPAYAELPLQIENPLTEQGKWKLEAGLTYANTNRSQITMKAPLLI